MNAVAKSSAPAVEILVVEDSPTQAQRLDHLLRQFGHHVTLAANGREAMEAVHRHKPTLIISDIVMPEMDGYELCRRVKSDPDLSDVPVILVTTLSDPQDVIRGLECRADNFILKPYDERYLLNRVQFVLLNREVCHAEPAGMGVEIYFNGQKHFITADRLQILNLLLSTYEAAIQRNKELKRTQEELQQANAGLQRLTSELEERVALRTDQLKRVNEALQAQLERLELLHRITRAIGERQDLPSIFQVVVSTLEEHLPADFCCICLYDRTDGSLSVANIGLASEALAEQIGMTERFCFKAKEDSDLGRCVRGQLAYTPEIRPEASAFARQLAGAGLHSLAAAPLVVEGKVFGVLLAGRREPRGLSAEECEFLRQLSEHVALAARQAQLYGALQQAYDDLRQTQQAVMQQERLRALGQMASGIAHDVNNAISPVVLYTEWLLEHEQGLTEDGRANLKIVKDAASDVAATVGRMREFYRGREPEVAFEPLQINSLVRQVLELTRVRWTDMPQKRGIVIQTRLELAPEPPPVMGAESEIREALINLVLNAADAMPHGGVLTLRTRVIEAAGKNGADPAALRRACVEVVDTGVGMDADARARCLEPFFTTKGERGTGLGLAMVYGTVQRHGAEIEIESAVGAGTTVRLVFPAPPARSASTAPAAGAAVPSRLRILVVDDDPLLLRSLRDALEGDGHEIVAVSNGQESIEIFRAARARGETFDVVMTDLGMPYVDGRKVASAVKAESPSTPVVLLTGWGQRIAEEAEMPLHVDHVIGKPPRLYDLREVLARCCPLAV